MAYGFEITTTIGVKNVLDVSSLQIAEVLHVVTASGSATITPRFDISRGGYVCKIIAGQHLPTLTFDNTTKLFTWARWYASGYNPDLVSNNFNVIFYHTD